jgi:hypothetical protein
VARPLGIDPSGTESILNSLKYRPIAVTALNHCLDFGHTGLLYFEAPRSIADRIHVRLQLRLVNLRGAGAMSNAGIVYVACVQLSHNPSQKYLKFPTQAVSASLSVG